MKLSFLLNCLTLVVQVFLLTVIMWDLLKPTFQKRNNAFRLWLTNAWDCSTVLNFSCFSVIYVPKAKWYRFYAGREFSHVYARISKLSFYYWRR